MKKAANFLLLPLLVLAGSLLQSSNLKKGKSVLNHSPAKEVKNSVRYTEDLIKIYEFSLNYNVEITKIVGKTGIESK